MAQGDKIEDRAAEWADALHHSGDDPAVRREFERWRDEDPVHDETYARIDRGYRAARAIEGTEIQHALHRETLERVEARQRRQRRRRRVFAAAASLVLAVAAVFTVSEDLREEALFQQARLLHALNGESLYRTAVGERRTIGLADGSTLTLNTDSRAVVHFSEAQPTTPTTTPARRSAASLRDSPSEAGLPQARGTRAITLLQGQALFEVARDPTRPFVVTAGNRKVTALGTKFDVRMTGERLEVTLIEGRVAVEDAESEADSSESPITNHQSRSSSSQSTGHRPQSTKRTTNNEQRTTILRPGQQLIAAVDLPRPVIRQADIRRAISWREGLLLFEDENLASAVSEVNRYDTRHIILADESLGDLRISGAFRVGKPETFLETISLYLPIHIVESTDNRILVGRRG